MDFIIQWLFSLVQAFAQFGNWLTQPLVGGFSPLSLISFGGIIFIIGVWIVKFLNPLS